MSQTVYRTINENTIIKFLIKIIINRSIKRVLFRKKDMAIELEYQIILNPSLETTSSKKLLTKAISF